MCTENSFSPGLHPQIEDLEDLGQSSLICVISPAVILIYTLRKPMPSMEKREANPQFSPPVLDDILSSIASQCRRT